jgi:hypothetical protein
MKSLKSRAFSTVLKRPRSDVGGGEGGGRRRGRGRGRMADIAIMIEFWFLYKNSGSS